MKSFDRISGVVTLVLGAAWAAALLLLASDTGMPMLVFVLLFWGGVAFFALWSLRVALHVLVARRTGTPFRVWRLLAAPAVLVACLALVWSGAAFRLRFELSRSALDRFAARALGASADNLAPGGRVGLFWVREVEVVGSAVRIITTDCGLDHCGLVHSQGEPPRIGEDSYRPLGGSWHHWHRSW